MDTSKTFGEKGNFTITYRTCPDSYNYSDKDKYAICHLVIGDTVLGNVDEECYLPTWFFQVTRIRGFFKENRGQLYICEFDKVSDREIYELIIKSNQLDSEFDVVYSYLPQLDNEVWQRHYLTLDETIDSFCTCYYLKDGQVRFVIEKALPKIAKGKNRIFLYKSIDFDLFTETLDQATDFLETTYPYLTASKISNL